MNQQELFILQLTTSFFAGGLLVATLTFFAEKASSRVAGIFLSFPSTAMLGIFFLGWTQSSGAVSKAIPSSLFALGITIVFPVIYVVLARFFAKKGFSRAIQVGMSFLLSALFWLCIVIPLVNYVHWSLVSGLVVYLILALISHLILYKQKPVALASVKYSKGQLAVRFLFIATMIFIVTLFGEIESTTVGGALSMFPAAFSSSIMILHWYHGADYLASAIRRVPIGSLSILAYALIVMFSFPNLGFVYGTLLAFVSCLIISYLLTLLPQK